MPDPNSAELCPGSRCEEGNVLLGLVNEAGRIDFLPERVEVDAQFVAAAKEGARPSSAFVSPRHV